ncbi:MAG: N-acetylmuramic acid 6-phosphate etherase [Roseibium sp.]|uniref:N-acetylmuramic acid 6-phosphate etherase n=1 Tax=Roseibium sp. TaxID=1936156 RepID=UPI00262E519F|nr:N-acetylmuramic acid 6-phosphate etherase [Roseibium sp.]MCV0424391.1 N-acetylmuramic acid 6-phosphate etherase [Roseibium sp.]
MPQRKTEQLYAMERSLDALPLSEAATAISRANVEAAQVVEACSKVIAQGAMTMAATIRGGGILYYVAAGSSGLMAAADAMELGGTFGIPTSQVRILMAGGVPTTANMPGDVEDESRSLKADLGAIGPSDCLIVVSASGDTPYAVTAAQIGKAAEAPVIAIANNRNAALFEFADHVIFLDTPPEILSGSTRLGAGTAQKIALNSLSTLMGVELGHVFRGRMVNLHADNEKLHARARRIVQDISDVDETTAAQALNTADNDVKVACLIASGARTPDEAQTVLRSAEGRIDRALARLETTKTDSRDNWRQPQ